MRQWILCCWVPQGEIACNHCNGLTVVLLNDKACYQPFACASTIIGQPHVSTQLETMDFKQRRTILGLIQAFCKDCLKKIAVLQTAHHCRGNGAYRQSQLCLQGLLGKRLALINSVCIILDIQELVHIGTPGSGIHAIHNALHPTCLPVGGKSSLYPIDSLKSAWTSQVQAQQGRRTCKLTGNKQKCPSFLQNVG